MLFSSCENTEPDLDTSSSIGNGILVYQSDFGLSDGAVAAMKGVALSIDPDLKIFDVTHDIPAYDIWSAAHRLSQSASYWPAGTVFVSVVDPGVGTDRTSAVLLTESGHIFVSPDNGTLSEVANLLGIADLRKIDHSAFTPGESRGNTFHGRDVYSRVGALLASGEWDSMAKVGEQDLDGVVQLDFKSADSNGTGHTGMIVILDDQYGNVWTNISSASLRKSGIELGETLNLKIENGNQEVVRMSIPYLSTFGDVAPGDALAYTNSVGNIALALNQDNFANRYKVGFGPEWKVSLSRAK